MKKVFGIVMVILMSAVFAFAAPTYEIEDMASSVACDVVQFNYYLGFIMESKFNSEKCEEVVGFVASLVVQNVKDMEDESLRVKAIENIKQYREVLVASLSAGCKKSKSSRGLNIKIYLIENETNICKDLLTFNSGSKRK